MNIAIDWDGTYTKDKDLFNRIIYLAVMNGHKVFLVSERDLTKENLETVQHKHCKTFLTGSMGKAEYLNRNGVSIDIWMDDKPITITKGIR